MNIYEDIAKRTQGDIYIGVVGPVRTGKSTFIRKFNLDFISFTTISDIDACSEVNFRLEINLFNSSIDIDVTS